MQKKHVFSILYRLNQIRDITQPYFTIYRFVSNQLDS